MPSRLRHRSPWLPLYFLLLVAGSSLADAADAGPAGGSDENAIDAFDDELLFVVGNTLFTIYHELGHGLIDLLGLPVIGREEDAVDGFAAVTMIPEEPDAVGDALIIAVADGWQVQSDLAAERQERHYWGEHALDEQRHFAIVCLMVGSDQDGFYDYALDAGLPKERIESCPVDFESMKSGWARLLNGHRPADDHAEGMPDRSIDLLFDQPLPGQDDVVDLLTESRLLTDAIFRFGESISLPSPIVIRFAACREANAYWSPGRSEVTVCYELVDEFRAILLESVAVR